jgi:hypothetical protein
MLFSRCPIIPIAAALIAAMPLPAQSAPDAIALLPPTIELTGPQASQRLLVEAIQGETTVGDVTAGAIFNSSDPNVARVTGDGRVIPTGNGAATITAERDGKTADAAVNVTGYHQAAPWNFRKHVMPVLTKAGCNSGACHGAAKGKNGFLLSLRGWDHPTDHAAITRHAAGRRVSKARPEKSLILRKATAQIKHGGGERFPIDSPDYRVIKEWIEAGTPEPTDADAIATRIEIFPTAATIPQGQSQQLLVRAHYSDGTTADVTDWAMYSTNSDTVAAVAPDGNVKIVGPGQAAVSVWFDSRVATIDLISPYPHEIDENLFAAGKNDNFIDALILEKLKTLRIAPSPLATDAEFIRRAYLDATGALPDADKVQAFLADPSPTRQKRADLIDELLASEAYADYWTYKWSDLLLLSSRNLQQGPLLVFHQFIRENVAANTPWDQFVKTIMTAQGSSIDNGAANYFVLHKEPIDLTETTSLAFMGLSLKCARCHNHPMEKWTTVDYYGMANLFARVKLKNGDRPGEVIVRPVNFGEFNHLLLGAPVPPRPLDGETLPFDAPTDRRVELSKWLTAPDNPYFTKSIVNRVWRAYMGRGLVEPEDDLRKTNPPSNTALFDALCKALVDHHYDLRHLMRTIMNSTAYQRSSNPHHGNDADQIYYSHYVVKRLPAEVILDAYAQVTGVPTPYPGYPQGWKATQLPDSRVASYFLDTFGRPERNETCACERTESATLTQALHISNGETLNKKLRDKSGLIEKLLNSDKTDQQILDDVFLAALSRPPNEIERKNTLALIQSDESKKETRREAIEDVLWALLTGKEFMFNH